MWRRIHLVLILVRLYFALSPSYLHPDENFQGPEVIAGEVFSYPVHHTWEFTDKYPIRSTFPLWLIYGLPMIILRSIWVGVGKGEPSPAVVYWTLRVLMFTLSFVLEDWALEELIGTSWRRRRIALLLVASSYVTWTYQTHTFSNAIETLVVLWSLYLVMRIVADKQHSGSFACAVLAFILVTGIFNRITFPAYVIVPGLRLIPHFRRKPLAFASLVFFGSLTACTAVYFDTVFYHPEATFFDFLTSPVITPLNNVLYNVSRSNLQKHGLHPLYQHFLVNLPLLIGPAFLLLPCLIYNRLRSSGGDTASRIDSAFCGTLLLSIFPHQEARFLIPAVPLLLSSMRLPRRFRQAWIVVWIIFNVIMGMLMGVFHQGGVVPMQLHLGKQDGIQHAFWWKTYSPPIWLLNGKNEEIVTTDLMGIPGDEMLATLRGNTDCYRDDGVYLVAPGSATFLDPYINASNRSEISLEEKWRFNRHLNLDDLDFGEDGVWPTLARVLGRRGLVLWRVERRCEA
ncbi:putative alpha 1,2-mannosyltransferase Smp3 [Trichodelitschia bisporula]|uniref:Mannosyltransferase n=1 Tax=Trichodelitschia bisporula TaxID=703511 RepID=A0A6G1I992_9PEZI|nr:putative alpha 1,2-mannosyltransferase Smp3 [Trichodelitschia bisporula]